MKIVIACDHAGFELKQKIVKWVKKQNIQVFDAGADHIDPQDSYVDHAKKAIEYYLANCDTQKDFLILICGSGVGMSIVANRHQKIRAVLALSKRQAVQARMHNNANCLCLGARNTTFFASKRIAKAFFETNFLGGKYLTRLNSI